MYSVNNSDDSGSDQPHRLRKADSLGSSGSGFFQASGGQHDNFLSFASGGTTGGPSVHLAMPDFYDSDANSPQRVSELSDYERLLFARKLFSFFSLQKSATALFVSLVYSEELSNRTGLREFIARESHLPIFLAAAFVVMLVLILVHSLMPSLRSKMSPTAWGRV